MKNETIKTETVTYQDWMFPLRVLESEDFSGFEIWTRHDERMGSRNNFALLGMIQHRADADRLCVLMNAYQITLCAVKP
jgi:hypothetical protein